MTRAFIPALSWKFLTPFFDFLCSLVGLGKGYRHRIIRALPVKEGNRIMDAGCGTGSLALQLKKQHPEVHVVGVDADPQILKLAEDKMKKEKVAIEYTQAFLQELPFKNNYFDSVVSSLVFHHLNTQAKKDSMKEIYRVLKKGGQFLLVDLGKPRNKLFAVFSLFSLLEEGRDNYQGRIPSMLVAAGFRDVKEIMRDKYNIAFVQATK